MAAATNGRCTGIFNFLAGLTGYPLLKGFGMLVFLKIVFEND